MHFEEGSEKKPRELVSLDTARPDELIQSMAMLHKVQLIQWDHQSA